MPALTPAHAVGSAFDIHMAFWLYHYARRSFGYSMVRMYSSFSPGFCLFAPHSYRVEKAQCAAAYTLLCARCLHAPVEGPRLGVSCLCCCDGYAAVSTRRLYSRARESLRCSTRAGAPGSAALVPAPSRPLPPTLHAITGGLPRQDIAAMPPFVPHTPDRSSVAFIFIVPRSSRPRIGRAVLYRGEM